MNKKTSRGFSLLEIITGMLILAIVVAGSVGTFITANRIIIQLGRRLMAQYYAIQFVETLKVYVTANPGSNLTTGTPPGASIVWSGTDPTAAPLSLPNINTIIPGATCSYSVTPIGTTDLREVIITVTLPTE